MKNSDKIVKAFNTAAEQKRGSAKDYHKHTQSNIIDWI